jgi:hypothetical protein
MWPVANSRSASKRAAASLLRKIRKMRRAARTGPSRKGVGGWFGIKRTSFLRRRILLFHVGGVYYGITQIRPPEESRSKTDSLYKRSVQRYCIHSVVACCRCFEAEHLWPEPQSREGCGPDEICVCGIVHHICSHTPKCRLCSAYWHVCSDENMFE